MAAVRFLFDEQVPEQLIDALVRVEPAIEVFCVGQPPAPAKGSPDQLILHEAETHVWLIVTLNKHTMPQFAAEHITAGRHTWGVILFRRGFPIARCVDDLLLLWSSSQ